MPDSIPDNATPASDSPRPKHRLLWLDALRGLALIAMATYHFSWDLEFFGYLAPGTSTEGFLRIYARSIASTFLFLAGFSLVLAHYPTLRLNAFLRRFAVILGAALAISAATFWFTPEGWIFFGILHCIALASLIGLLFLRLPVIVTLLVAGAALLLPGFFRSTAFDTPFLWFAGLSENLPRSNDYVPLFPWIGALLIGIAIARLLVDQGLLPRLSRLPDGPAWLRWAGRHSLTVYLLHQPVLIALVFAASHIIPPPAPDPIESYIGSCEPACRQQGNTAAICQAFCACTLDKLQSQNLLDPLQSGAILPDQDERILALASECTAKVQTTP
ncbi:heparan-alpha-glucosaminide N-acetyltransferase [Rhizobium wuzhouense]|uniref:heparan-alpha-glucosaminide N-acetyltransferase n=1 Tax=Rhizobium wuzhouense TaxID=1986026 RepID=UPI001FE0CC80|nr:heparan-alpha-glucosaminide N-acetyltransferase [Rhizobium wuzhouense]